VTVPADTRIAGGRVLLDGRLEPRDVLVTGGVVAGLCAPGDDAPAAAVVDARGRLVLPGLVDAHTHSYAQLARDTIPDDRLEPWLARAVAAGAGLDAEAVAVAAQLSALDALRHGATTTLDHATLGDGHAAALVAAYDAVGARVALAAQVADVGFADSLHGVDPATRAAVAAADDRAPATAAHQLGRCRELLDAAAGHERVHVLLGPSAPERCSPALLEGVAALAAEHGAGLHVHLLETPQQRAGGDPLGTLADHGLLRGGLSLAHCVHLTADDVARLAAAGAGVVHNPLSNLSLGSGRLDLRALLDAGVAVGLGCDGWNTGGGQDVLQAARLALAGRRPETPAAEWLAPAEVLPLAGAGGAAAIGLPPGTGRIAPGGPADLLLVDPGRAGFLDGEDVAGQLVMGGLGAGLREAWVAGRPVLIDGDPLLIDGERLRARAAELLPRLRAAAAPHLELARRLATLLRAAGPVPSSV
jgi:guanine deaminase